jgi:hypothetical protein
VFAVSGIALFGIAGAAARALYRPEMPLLPEPAHA